MTLYTYSVADDTLNGAVDAGRLKVEIQADNDITIALEGIDVVADDLNIEFKAVLSTDEQTALGAVVGLHTGEPVPTDPEVRTDDGRMRVRADSLPIGMTTMFTCCGDGTDIGNGECMYWDFSNTDNDVTAPTGYKRKQMDITFADPVYIKEGCLYAMDAKKGSYVTVQVVCPDQAYYLDRQGVPQQASGDTPVGQFLPKHFFAGSFPMGDELNTEVAQDNPIPVGYKLRCIVTVPDTDSDSYGWASLELYRQRTILLPGEDL